MVVRATRALDVLLMPDGVPVQFGDQVGLRRLPAPTAQPLLVDKVAACGGAVVVGRARRRRRRDRRGPDDPHHGRISSIQRGQPGLAGGWTFSCSRPFGPPRRAGS
jgi:hypothetical protein